MRTLILILMAVSAIGCANEKAFQYCPSNEGLPAATGQPTILVIGDSISTGYTPTLEAELSDTYNVVHNPCNAMTTVWTRQQIDSWLDSRASFEAIIFNNGLWDIADWEPTTDTQYVANLHVIAQKIKAKTSRPLFVLTTEVLPGTSNRNNADVVNKNNLAITVMAQEGIPVLDLYSVSQTLQAEHVNPTDVHYTDEGSEALGDAILNELNTLYGIQ